MPDEEGNKLETQRNVRRIPTRAVAIVMASLSVLALAATTGYVLASGPQPRTGTNERPLASSVQAADSVLGSWHVTVQVDGSTTTFDTLYSFASGGAFSRVDGRNNVPGLGTWKRDGDSIVFTFELFAFDASGKRVGTISAPCRATVHDGKLSGTFTATEVDVNGNPIASFHKTGTFEGVRIEPS